MAQLTSLQTKVAGQILSAIQSGDLQPGSHLKEVELSQRLGVSRSPIRSALSYLAEQQLIEPLPQQGFRVPLQTSAGLAEQRPGEGAIALLQRADEALYRAKEGGRDRLEASS